MAKNGFNYVSWSRDIELGIIETGRRVLINTQMEVFGANGPAGATTAGTSIQNDSGLPQGPTNRTAAG
jgi:hypothetical protein